MSQLHIHFVLSLWKSDGKIKNNAATYFSISYKLGCMKKVIFCFGWLWNKGKNLQYYNEPQTNLDLIWTIRSPGFKDVILSSLCRPLVYQSQGVFNHVKSRGRRWERLGLCLQELDDIYVTIVSSVVYFSHLYEQFLQQHKNTMVVLDKAVVSCFKSSLCDQGPVFVQIIIFIMTSQQISVVWKFVIEWLINPCFLFFTELLG